jgi:hypothetical protein
MSESRRQVRAWHAEERARLILDSITDYAIFMLDRGGYVESWNLGAERIKGYRAEEIVGQHFSRFYPAEDVAAGKPAAELDAAGRSGRLEDEGWRIRKDGTRFWANVVLTAMRDAEGRLEGFAKVTRDLTERRAAEADRLRLAQAEEAVRLRDEFLSIAAHELKTPLTALNLNLHSLRRTVQHLDPRAATRVTQAVRSSERLSELVAMLLDSTRLASNGFELVREPFLLADAVRDVLDAFLPAATQAGCALTLSVEGEARGVWDRRRIEQVVGNLVSNALRHGASTPVHVRVTVEQGEAVVAVEDQGPGLGPEVLARVFGRYERASSPRHHGGLGLGLYVSRGIVAAHGGSIEARNRPGGGACFTVRLPLGDGR